MNPGLRRLHRVVVCLLVAGAAVSMRASADWASAGALGDVAIAFDNQVQLFANADGTLKETIDIDELTGTNTGLAFDTSLDLLVTNTDAQGSGRIVTLASADPHGSIGTPITTQASPRSLAIAADGTIYVASPGGTIRRYDKTGALSRTFTIATDSTACIGIDLSPDQSTLYVVSGGRNIRTITGVEKPGGPAPVAIFATLPNPGTACGLRLLATVDVRSTPPPPVTPSAAVGGLLIADKREIKRLNSLGAVVETFNAGPESDSQKDWSEIAVDPDTQAFFGIDAAQWRLARFRMGAANAFFVELSSAPRGVAVNGELRVAQTVRLLNLTANVEGTATFLEPPFQHSWRGTVSTAASLAIQAIEVTYDDDGTVPPAVCQPSLNVRCRLQNFDSPSGNPLPKPYSRGRPVFYREILRTAVPDTATIRIMVTFPGNDTDTFAGSPCVVGIDPQPASALLRDPFPHDLFSWDPSLVLYGGDDGITTKTIRFNDSIIVDRADGLYNMEIIRPVFGAVGQLGRSLPITVVVTDPATCNAVAGLESVLVLSVVDITNGIDAIIGDSPLGIYGTLDANGLIWASVANQYRTGSAPLEVEVHERPYLSHLCNGRRRRNG